MKKLFLILIFCLATFVSLAQTGGPTPEPSAEAVPIDGGISILLAAGAAYGVKKILEEKRQK